MTAHSNIMFEIIIKSINIIIVIIIGPIYNYINQQL